MRATTLFPVLASLLLGACHTTQPAHRPDHYVVIEDGRARHAHHDPVVVKQVTVIRLSGADTRAIRKLQPQRRSHRNHH